MNKAIRHEITVKGKRYTYFLRVGKLMTYIKCEGANIAQGFANEDVAGLIKVLPDFIIEEQNHQKKDKQSVIRFRISTEDKVAIEKKAMKKGYSSVSMFLRDLALEA